ncbi:MAG: hypothetical protein AAFX85_10600, partial [Pseudomonadota bacterium]
MSLLNARIVSRRDRGQGEKLPTGRLLWIPLLTGILVALVIFGLMQVSKGGHLHQLNARHAIYSFELTTLLEQSEGRPLPVDELAEIVENIRQQPIECLQELTVSDRLLMRLAGTSNAVSLCEEDA